MKIFHNKKVKKPQYERRKYINTLIINNKVFIFTLAAIFLYFKYRLGNEIFL